MREAEEGVVCVGNLLAPPGLRGGLHHHRSMGSLATPVIMSGLILEMRPGRMGGNGDPGHQAGPGGLAVYREAARAVKQSLTGPSAPAILLCFPLSFLSLRRLIAPLCSSPALSRFFLSLSLSLSLSRSLCSSPALSLPPLLTLVSLSSRRRVLSDLLQSSSLIPFSAD